MKSIWLPVGNGIILSRKISEAANISKMGLKVFFVNGNKPERIVNAVNRKKFEGTLFQ